MNNKINIDLHCDVFLNDKVNNNVINRDYLLWTGWNGDGGFCNLWCHDAIEKWGNVLFYLWCYDVVQHNLDVIIIVDT